MVDVVESEETNACTVDLAAKYRRRRKQDCPGCSTRHNHPRPEIEPFGGVAATLYRWSLLGDPLSGELRYAAMRVTA